MYISLDMLDMNMLYLQIHLVYGKLLVSHYMSFIYREGFSWPNNSTAFGLVQPKPAPILE